MRRITEMTRAQFVKLYDDILSDAIDERWPEDYKAHTRAEKVEERRIRVMGMLGVDKIAKLIEDDQWTWMEVLEDKESLRVRAYVSKRG